MNISKELLQKADHAKTAKELLTLAKEENIELTEEEAAKAFAELHKTGELEDDELDNVSAGGCFDDKPKKEEKRPEPKFTTGQEVRVEAPHHQFNGYINEIKYENGTYKYFINWIFDIAIASNCEWYEEKYLTKV